MTIYTGKAILFLSQATFLAWLVHQQWSLVDYHTQGDPKNQTDEDQKVVPSACADGDNPR